MASYGNFQSDNAKYTQQESRSYYNADFNNTVSASGENEFSALRSNIDKYVDFVSWCRWYPDLFLDLIKPKHGGINLHTDQRTFLRIAMRFINMYGVYPRGWSKTMLEELTMYLACVFFPNIEFALTAQTKENASELLKDKYNDILKKYPWFRYEIYSSKFSKNDAEILFINGSRIDVLANAQTSKGQRRNVIMIEESALIDDFTFQDALLPIVEHGRLTVGKLGILNPEELSQKICFFTTAGFRGSDEFERSIKMTKDMANLEGKMVIGSDWHLGCWYGRGSTKKQILDKKRNMSPTAFDQNYNSHWVGCAEGGLVNVSQLLESMTLGNFELSCPLDKNGEYELNEYVIAGDISRSASESNNKSAFLVLKVLRKADTSIKKVQLINIISPPNGLNFEQQSNIIKKIFYQYGGNLDMLKSRVKAIVLDINGVGQGVLEELLKDSKEIYNGKPLGCFASINTEDVPQVYNAPKVVYGLKAQGINGDIIRIFIDFVESHKLELYKNFKEVQSSIPNDLKEIDVEQVCANTKFLIDEIVNLKIKKTSSSITVEQVVRRVDKDRYSALVYGLYYIFMFLSGEIDDIVDDEDDEYVYY